MRVAIVVRGVTAYQDVCYRALSERGHQVLVVHPDSVPYAPFEPSPSGGGLEHLVWSGTMPTPRELNARLEEFAPSVLMIGSWSGRSYRAVARAWRGRALRVLFSSNFWRGTLRQVAGLALGRVYVKPLADCVWVPGERSESFARRLGFGGRDVIRGANSADTTLFSRGERSGEELASHRRFLFAGRLIWHKAPDVLAKAYRDYRTQVEDPWELVIVGDGPSASTFDGIEGVNQRGFLQPRDLAALMHESSALVFPSHVEWYGVVVHEAGAAGLPLICSDGVGAVTMLLQDGFNGWTVPAGDTECLTAAMVRMSTAPPERLQAMSDGSRALASRLSPQIWAQNFEEQVLSRLS